MGRWHVTGKDGTRSEKVTPAPRHGRRVTIRKAASSSKRGSRPPDRSAARHRYAGGPSEDGACARTMTTGSMTTGRSARRRPSTARTLLPAGITGAERVARNLLRFWGTGTTLVSLPVGGQPALLGFADRKLVGMLVLPCATRLSRRSTPSATPACWTSSAHSCRPRPSRRSRATLADLAPSLFCGSSRPYLCRPARPADKEHGPAPESQERACSTSRS